MREEGAGSNGFRGENGLALALFAWKWRFSPLHPPVFVNRLDYLSSPRSWRSRFMVFGERGGRVSRSISKGDASIRWATIGLSVLATQAGPITFLSMPGQAYEHGIGFIQNYFGQPLALVVVCAVFVPIYQRLKVYTAYQYLGQRFDRKTQLLGAFLFLVQRGIAAGITVYAPAIILSALLGWRLNLTIWLAGGLVIIYTVLGGTKIVSITQRYQMIVIMIGMGIAFGVAVHRLSPELSFGHALSVAGKMGKLEAVDFSIDPHKRYTFWSGVIGGFFLALSYFGADQSQVQRYLAGDSLKESRFGLLFNAVVKVPMQFFILLLGAIVFMFYQFEKPPVYYNQPAYERAVESGFAPQLAQLKAQSDRVFEESVSPFTRWPSDRRSPGQKRATPDLAKLRSLDAEARNIRDRTKAVLKQAGADPSKGIRLRVLTFAFAADATRLGRTAGSRHFVRHHVGDGGDFECPWLNHRDRFLSAFVSAGGQRSPLCFGYASAHRCLGADGDRSRFLRQSCRKSDRGRQHSGFSLLWKHPWPLSRRILHPQSERLGGFCRGLGRASARLRALLYHEHRLPLV
jgi:SSS family transporter